MSNKRDYAPMKLGPSPQKQLLFLGVLVLCWALVALAACLITHHWTWEFFGKVFGMQAAICYIVGEIYFASRNPW